MAGRVACVTLAALLAAAPVAGAHVAAPPATRAAAITPAGACAGSAFAADRVFEGEAGTELQGSHLMLPFEVPAGTTAVHVRYCHDQPEGPASSQIRHTLDLGLWDAREPGGQWGEADFRGWGGSSHPDVWVSPQGFSDESHYVATGGRGQVPGRTTRGFVPGPVPAGEWAVELDVAAVVPREQGDADGRVRWRVEVELSDDPAHAAQPYEPAPYDATPARSGPGWYAGDLHVHAEHSALGDATMRETFDYAFSEGQFAGRGAGLDFVTLSDYVTSSAWGEIGRHQERYPGRLIVRSAEVITYRGHMNNQGSARYVDHRTGRVLGWRDDGDDRLEAGELDELRPARPASEVLGAIRSAGGWTQINHPTTFPATVPPFALLCRGCSWEYSAAETDWSRVDAIEVATGPAGLKDPPRPGPNPFTPLALALYDGALASGARIAAVGSSDSHNAGRTPGGVTQSPIGEATTVVYADELSEDGLARAIRARHTYVKMFGPGGPDLRFDAVAPDGSRAMMGDVLRAERAALTARVLGAAPALTPDRGPAAYQLLVLRDGAPVAAAPVAADPFVLELPAVPAGRYRLQLMRGSAIEAVTSPIWVEP